MKAVVDTNVIAYYLLGTDPFAGECATFWERIKTALAPASWEAEITNVLWMAVRAKIITLPDALHRLDLAAGLGLQSVPTSILWRGALARAVSTGVAAYDTLFVELAYREGIPLATFDAAVLKAFPNVAKRPGNLH